jgi:hypothetical protein
VLAGLEVVLSVRETVHSKSELCGVEREGFQQDAEAREAREGGLVAQGLSQKFVEDLSETGAVGFYDREMSV